MNDNSTRMIIDDPDAPQLAVESARAAEPEPSADTSFVLLTRDFEWPDHGVKLRARLPQPAVFRRAYRAEVHRKIINKRVPILRLVFLAREDGPEHEVVFAVQTLLESVLLSNSESDPIPLETVIGPSSEPVMLWQLTKYTPAASPKAAEVKAE